MDDSICGCSVFGTDDTYRKLKQFKADRASHRDDRYVSHRTKLLLRQYVRLGALEMFVIIIIIIIIIILHTSLDDFSPTKFHEG